MTTKSNKSVSIRPDDFSTDLPDLSRMPLEEVVARFKDTEKRRTIHIEPDNEQEVPYMIREAPSELISSLKVISVRLGIPRSVLTKCLSRQVADWYANSIGIGELATTYNSIYNKIKMKSYTTLRVQAEHPARFRYVYPAEDVHTSISTIRWVLAKLIELKDVVGVPVSALLLAGFCWSLTTLENKDWDSNNIERFFTPEANNIHLLIADRIVDVRALCAKYEYRNDHPELTV